MYLYKTSFTILTRESGERVNDITFWKDELFNEIRVVEAETEQLQVLY